MFRYIANLFRSAGKDDVLARGIAAMAKGRFRTAEPLFRDLTIRYPEDREAYEQLSCLYLRENRMQEAKSLYREMIGVGDSAKSAVQARATAAEKDGRPQIAEALYRELITRYPQETEPYARLADILLSQDRAAEAETLLRQLLAIDPTDVAATADLAELLHERGDLADAETHFRRVHALDPDHGVAVQLARLLTARDARDEAEALLSQSLITHPDDDEVAMELGLLLAQRGEAVGAERHFRRVIALFAKEPKGYLHLAAALTAQGRLQEAGVVLNDGLALLPGDADLAAALAAIPES